jgi:azurin
MLSANCSNSQASSGQQTRRSVVQATLLVPILLASCKRATPDRPAQYVDLLVESDGDLLTFKPAELSCPTGARVRLTFRHTGKYVSFQHNWLLILPGSFDAVTREAEAAGEGRGWLPTGDRRILAATALCGKGQIATIEFVAPAPGDYPFICSVPGHAQSMWGVLHVTPVGKRSS